MTTPPNRPGAAAVEPITTETLAATVLVAGLLTVGQVCARYPGKGGRRMAPSTVTRWILFGCPGRDGLRVKLRATRCGARWLVDPDDLTAFFDALAGPARPPPAVPARRDDAERRLAAARAALARRGA